MHLQTILERVDQQRRRLGFLTIGETVALAESNNAVLDPFSDPHQCGRSTRPRQYDLSRRNHSSRQRGA